MNNCNCFTGISKLHKCEILALVNALALALSEGLDEEDLETLGNLLTTIGDTIALFASVNKDENKDKDKNKKCDSD